MDEKYYPKFWQRLCLSRQSDAFNFDAELSWLDVANLPSHEFKTKLSLSRPYAAFMARALIGNVDDLGRENKWNEFSIFKSPDDRKLQIHQCLSKSMLEDVSYQTLIGADLVARVCLMLTRDLNEIHESEGFIKYWPVINDNCFSSISDEIHRRLSFVSADFVEAKCSHRVENLSKGNSEQWHYYHFGWENGEPRSEYWLNYGWRTGVESVFYNDLEKAKKDASAIETLMAFSQFYGHSDASFAIILKKDCIIGDEVLRKNATKWSDFYEFGIRRYIDSKRKEFESIPERQKSAARIVICIGVAEQKAGFFDPLQFEHGFGVFITVDILDSDSGVGDKECREIIKALNSSRLKIKYRMLHLLSSRLVHSLKYQNRRLAKSDTMLNLMQVPLKRITESLAIMQAEAQELRSILYDPMEAVFSCQPRIADLFREETVPGITTAHRLSQLAPDQKNAVVTLALRRLRGAEDIEITGDYGLVQEIKLYKSYEQSQEESLSSVKGLAVAVKQVFGLNEWNDFLSEEGSSDKPVNINEKLINRCLEALKDRFLTHYKPEGSVTHLSWKSVYPFLKGLISNQMEVDGNLWLLANCSNPLSTHGHFIEFLRSFLRQHHSSDNNISSHIENEGRDEYSLDAKAKVKIEFKSSRSDWIDEAAGQNSSELHGFLERQIELRRKNAMDRGEYGDFHGAFVKFISRMPHDIVKDCCLHHDKSCKKISLTVQDNFKIELVGKSFTILTGYIE